MNCLAYPRQLDRWISAVAVTIAHLADTVANVKLPNLSGMIKSLP